MVKQSTYEQMAAEGKVEEALANCERDAEAHKTARAFQLYADALHAMASILKYYQSDYEKGLEFLDLEIQIRLKHDLPDVDAAYLKAAILHMYLNRNEEVIAHAHMALKHTSKDRVKATALNVLGDTIFKTDPVKAADYFKEAEQLFIAEKDVYNLSHVRLSIARLLGFTGKVEQAMALCQQELEKGLSIKNPGIMGTGFLRLAEIHHFNNAPKEAATFADKAYQIGRANNWAVLMEEAEGFMEQ